MGGRMLGIKVDCVVVDFVVVDWVFGVERDFWGGFFLGVDDVFVGVGDGFEVGVGRG